MKNTLTTCLFALSAAFCANMALCAPVLDQSQTSYNGFAQVSLNRSLCQTFTAGATGYLTDVSISLDGSFYNEQAPATIEIVDTSGGLPNNVLWSASYSNLSPGWFDVPISNGAPNITAGTVYGIVLVSSNTGTQNRDGWNAYFPVPASGSTLYAGGSLLENRGSAWQMVTMIGGSGSQPQPNADAAFKTSVTPGPITSVYTGGNSQTWDLTTNWTQAKPVMPGDTAMFSQSFGTTTTVTLDTPQTVSNITFSASNGYTIASASSSCSLTLNNGSGSTNIGVSNGTHEISAPIVLDSSLVVSQSGNTSLIISEGINGYANSLVETGQGTLILSGTDNYTGGTFVNSGEMIVTKASALPQNGSLTVGAGGTFIFGSPNPMAFPSASVQKSSAVLESVPEPDSMTLILIVAAMFLIYTYCKRRFSRR